MLYPIRVDASSSDNTVRVIDTILIDPTCLPVPPPLGRHTDTHPSSILASAATPVTSGNDHARTDGVHECAVRSNHEKHDLEQETIRLNAAHLARTLIADMEVEGITHKSAKIGRLRLLQNESLMQQVQQQILQQLKAMLQKEKQLSRCRNSINSSSSSSSHGHKKRKRMDVDTKQEDPSCEDNNGCGDGGSNQSNLVDIYIRIKENGICFTDQFQVDVHPKNQHLCNPILLASRIVKDMNLPQVMTQSIAVSIAEQIHGLKVPQDLQGLSFAAKGSNETTTPSMPVGIHRTQVEETVPTAWKMEEREEGIAKKIHASVGKPGAVL